MGKSISLGLLLSLIFGAVGCLAAPPPEILAYYDSDSANDDRLAKLGDSFNQVSTDVFNVTTDGDVAGDVPTKAIAIAKSRHMAVYACFSNYSSRVNDFDPVLGHAVLATPAVQTKLIANLMALVRKYQYTGVNVDMEGLYPADRVVFTRFMHDLSSAMHAEGFVVVISVPAKLRDEPADTWSGAFDLKAIGEYVDIVQLMSYDENGPWGAPGPVAGTDWVTASARYTISVVPAKKVSLGLAAYGYDWNTTKKTGVSVAWRDIPALIKTTGGKPSVDAGSGSPTFTYVANDKSSHIVWYEDAASIGRKVSLAATYKMAGVSVWSLGSSDASFWNAVHAGFK